MNNAHSVITDAKHVFDVEIQALQEVCRLVDDKFVQAVELMFASKGKVIICGMGKSGIIGHKISATLSSTGTPSMFLHPAEAFHGDLGMVEPDDVVLLMSYSGETDEVLRVVPFFRENKNALISMTGNASSTLARYSDVHLLTHVSEEACSLGLAPTSSTTAMLVAGDAIAVVLMNMRGFREEDFAVYHPGGSLGRRLLTRASDMMKTDPLPCVPPTALLKDVVKTISTSGFGVAVVIADNTEEILGVITDGDIRRAMEREDTFFELIATDVMTSSPKTISPTARLEEVQTITRQYKISTLLVVEEHKLVGIIQSYDL